MQLRTDFPVIDLVELNDPGWIKKHGYTSSLGYRTDHCSDISEG